MASVAFVPGRQYGDHFLFVDYSNYGKSDVETQNVVLAEDEPYAEPYANFSVKKVTSHELNLDLIDATDLLAGFNFVPEIDPLYYLPVFRVTLISSDLTSPT